MEGLTSVKREVRLGALESNSPVNKTNPQRPMKLPKMFTPSSSVYLLIVLLWKARFNHHRFQGQWKD